MTDGRKIDRDRLSIRRLLGSGFFIALFLISGLAQQMHWTDSFFSESTARRDFEESTRSDDVDPAESESPPPAEEIPLGRDTGEFGNASLPRSIRAGTHPLPMAILPETGRDATLRPAFRFVHTNPSPRASGRALRQLLQSHLC